MASSIPPPSSTRGSSARRNRHEGARDELSARDFLRMLAAAPIAVSARPRLQRRPSPAPSRDGVLYGGNDGCNTFVPTRTRCTTACVPTLRSPPTRSSSRRRTDSIRRSPRSCPRGKLRTWHSCRGWSYPECTQQHYQDIESAFTGCDGREFSAEGWVTRALAGTQRDRDRRRRRLRHARHRRAADLMGPFRGRKLGALQVYRADDLLRSRHIAGTSSMRRRVDARCCRARRTTWRP